MWIQKQDNSHYKLIQEEAKAVLVKEYKIDISENETVPQFRSQLPNQIPSADKKVYDTWLKTNVFEQKQKGLFGVYIKMQLGNISTTKARELARIAKLYTNASDIRITINQGFLLRDVGADELPFLFNELSKLELATPGFDSVGDITTCPGTDTCNLAISNSTNISVELEKVIYAEYPELIYNHDIKIKISGCMNACGQHSLAQIGFHGSSFKLGTNVVPALQVLLGGGTLGKGAGRISDKTIKVAALSL